MENKGNRLAKWIGTLSIIIIAVFLVAAFSPEPKCTVSGCNNERMAGLSYCYLHHLSSGSSHKYTNKSSGGSSYSTGKGSANGGSKGYSAGKGSSGTNTYKSLEYDPDDYDSAEDYADDAWGNDFDDWEEAYDYWENY